MYQQGYAQQPMMQQGYVQQQPGMVMQQGGVQQFITVTVPQGAFPGSTFEVVSAGGRAIMVTVPQGSMPGAQVRVQNPDFAMVQQQPRMVAPAVQQTTFVGGGYVQPMQQTVVVGGGMPYGGVGMGNVVAAEMAGAVVGAEMGMMGGGILGAEMGMMGGAVLGAEMGMMGGGMMGGGMMMGGGVSEEIITTNGFGGTTIVQENIW